MILRTINVTLFVILVVISVFNMAVLEESSPLSVPLENLFFVVGFASIVFACIDFYYHKNKFSVFVMAMHALFWLLLLVAATILVLIEEESQPPTEIPTTTLERHCERFCDNNYNCHFYFVTYDDIAMCVLLDQSGDQIKKIPMS